MPIPPHQAKRARLRGTPFCDIARWLTAEILGVALGVLFPLLRQIVERENRRHRADRHAGTAINALDRIDVQHLFSRELVAVLLGVNAVHRTGIDAGRVLGADTRFRDHISHKTVSPINSLEWSNPGWSGNNDTIKKSQLRGIQLP